MDLDQHWQQVYQTKRPDTVSWFRPHLETSLQMLQCAGVSAGDSLIDVGGGASTFVDDLLDVGFGDLTVLDVSSAALDVARARLGTRQGSVTWITADVTQVVLPAARYRVWHDRAVFHFLTSPEDQDRYLSQVRRAVVPGGFLILATFGPDGPRKCSGLPTARYGSQELHALFAPDFEPVESREDWHTTPAGSAQQFVYCL